MGKKNCNMGKHVFAVVKFSFKCFLKCRLSVSIAAVEEKIVLSISRQKTKASTLIR